MYGFNSPDDQPTPTFTAADLDAAEARLIKRVRAMTAAIRGHAFDGKELVETCGGLTLEDVRAKFERSILSYREGVVHAATGREPPTGNVPALVAAVRALDEQSAPTAASADRALTVRQQDRGASIVAALPPYDAGAVAPCADLARVAEGHPYGKCGTGFREPKRPHGAYEAGLHPSSAA